MWNNCRTRLKEVFCAACFLVEACSWAEIAASKFNSLISLCSTYIQLISSSIHLFIHPLISQLVGRWKLNYSFSFLLVISQVTHSTFCQGLTSIGNTQSSFSPIMPLSFTEEHLLSLKNQPPWNLPSSFTSPLGRLVLHIYIPILAACKKFVMMDVVYRPSLSQVSYITAQW